MRIVKGAFATVIGARRAVAGADTSAKAMEAQGMRVMAVAVGPAKAMKLIGLIALDRSAARGLGRAGRANCTTSGVERRDGIRRRAGDGAAVARTGRPPRGALPAGRPSR